MWRSRARLVLDRLRGQAAALVTILVAQPGLARAHVRADQLALRIGTVLSLPWRPRRRRRIAECVAGLPSPPLVPPVLVVDPLEPTDLLATGGGSAGAAICFAPFGADAPDPAWVARARAALGDGVVAATPTLLFPVRPGIRGTEHDGLVSTAGFEIELGRSGAPEVRARWAGRRPSAYGRPAEVIAAPLQGLVVDRAAYDAAGGLAADTDPACAAIDLCLRLRERGGRVVHVPDAMAFDRRPVASRRRLRTPADPTSTSWAALVDRWGPRVLGRSSSPRTPSVAITTAVPTRQVARRWGDWHLAEGLARGLRRQGVDVTVRTHGERDDPAARVRDVHLVLRGNRPVRRSTGQRHVLWIISHPESVTAEECDEADLVLVASPSFAESLRRRTRTPVEVMLQATDPMRFSPGATGARSRDVVVVAKSRDVRRRVVADAIEAGLRPVVYGSGWEGLIDPDLVREPYIDNTVLPVIYRHAGVVLNDHWDAMREQGFVSNRIFDVLACGSPVISDDVEGLDELFDGAVPAYRTVEELRSLVAEALDEPDVALERAARGRQAVLQHHTFDHRAEELLALLRRLPALGPGRMSLAT